MGYHPKHYINQCLVMVWHHLIEFEPYIHCTSVTTNSLYVKFNKGYGSLRISDHRGKKKYSYTWNIRVDRNFVDKVEDSRYYSSYKNAEKFILWMKEQFEKKGQADQCAKEIISSRLTQASMTTSEQTRLASRLLLCRQGLGNLLSLQSLLKE